MHLILFRITIGGPSRVGGPIAEAPGHPGRGCYRGTRRAGRGNPDGLHCQKARTGSGGT